MSGKQLSTLLVKKMFTGLAVGKPQDFFQYVASDVRWTVSNPKPEHKTHPLAGLYTSVEDFQNSTFKPLSEKLKEPIRLSLMEEPIVSDNRAVVELRAVTANGQTPQAKNGVEFDNRYAWVLQWDPEKEKVVEVRAYLDSAMVNQALKD